MWLPLPSVAVAANIEFIAASSAASTAASNSGDIRSLGRSTIGLGSERRCGVRRTSGLVENATAYSTEPFVIGEPVQVAQPLSASRWAPAWRGSAIGTYRLWRDLGFGVGAVAVGIVADRLGAPTAIGLVGALTAASGLIVQVRMREIRRPA